jgi:ribulose-phosphate 3-epimerase
MTLIVPAILEATKEGFAARAERFERLPDVERIQVDFCDGEFVPYESVAISDVDILNPAISWEAHLMVMEPVDFFDYQMAGFGTVIVHVEAFPNLDSIIPALKQIKSYGLKAGLALNIETPVRRVQDYVDYVDQFTLMSVHPGRQGQQFLPEALERVSELRSMVPDAVIEVDGGINEHNARSIADVGADMLAVGSALATDPQWDLEKMREAVK